MSKLTDTSRGCFCTMGCVDTCRLTGEAAIVIQPDNIWQEQYTTTQKQESLIDKLRAETKAARSKEKARADKIFSKVLEKYTADLEQAAKNGFRYCEVAAPPRYLPEAEGGYTLFLEDFCDWLRGEGFETELSDDYNRLTLYW